MIIMILRTAVRNTLVFGKMIFFLLINILLGLRIKISKRLIGEYTFENALRVDVRLIENIYKKVFGFEIQMSKRLLFRLLPNKFIVLLRKSEEIVAFGFFTLT